MHAAKWNGPPDLGDHHGAFMCVTTAAALLSLQQDLRSMSAVLLSMRAAVAAAVPAVGDAPADEA